MNSNCCFTTASGRRRLEVEEYEEREDRRTKDMNKRLRDALARTLTDLLPSESTLGDLDEIISDVEMGVKKVWRRRSP